MRRIDYANLPLMKFVTLFLLAPSFVWAMCSDHLENPRGEDSELAAIEHTQMRLETYSQIFPGFIPLSQVKDVFLPLLELMKEKARHQQGFAPEELESYRYLKIKLDEAPFLAEPLDAPNKGLRPPRAREILRFYEPWEWPLLF